MEDLRPELEIIVDGQSLPEGKGDDVRSVEVLSEIGKVTKATLVVRNWDADTNSPEEDEDAVTFDVGKPILISLGRAGELTQVFDGLILAVRARCRSGEIPEYEVTCRCRGILLNGSQAYRVWADQSDFDAVSSICSELNLSVDGKPGSVQPFVIQHRCNAWEFVLNRSRSLGLQVYVRGKKLNFQPPATKGKPMAELNWPSNVNAIDLSQDLRNTFNGATAHSWSPIEKKAVNGKADAGSSSVALGKRPDPSGLVASAEFSKSRSRSVSDCAPMDLAELNTWASALVDKSRLDSYYGNASIDGDATIQIDGVVEVTGLGKNLDGPHYVTSVRHCYAPGKFSSVLRFGTPPELAPVSSHRPERSMDPIHALVIASVESFEDADQSQGRVQIRFEWMSAEEPPVWARLATPGAGAGRGLLFVPEPDDEVLVQFVDGDPRFPVVVGSVWNGKDAPPAPYDPQKNDRRSLVSRLGHSLVFDDGQDRPGFFVETKSGQKVSIDDSSGSESIQMEDKTGNKLRLDSSGISLTAASGKTIKLDAPGGSIELSANQIKAKSDTTVDLEAGATGTFKASAQLNLKGAQVAINGDAMVSAQAPMIKLN